MTWQFNQIAIASLITALIAIALAMVAGQRRDRPGSMFFALMMLAVAEWALLQVCEIAVVELPAKVFFGTLEYPGIVSVPVLWLLFAADYTRRDQWLTRRNHLLLWVIPSITLLMVLTNSWHRLFWSDIVPGVIPSNIIYLRGPYFWVHVIYSYAMLAAGTAILILSLRHSESVYRTQVGAILLAAIVPWLGNLVYLLDLIPVRGLDITPPTLALTGIIIAWGILRYRFLDLMPTARNVVVESMLDGILVVDAQDRLVDLNPAAWQILSTLKRVIGSPIHLALVDYPELLRHLRAQQETQTEIRLGQTHPRDYELRVSFLPDRRGRAVGRLVTLRDITQRKESERAEREQRALAEALRDAASALNSTLKLEEVLDRILTNLGQVTAYDIANIMFVENDTAKVVRTKQRSDSSVDLSSYTGFTLDIHQVNNFREMMATRQPVVVPNTMDAPTWEIFPESAWIKSYVGVPIIASDQIIGFLNLDSSIPGYYNANHAERIRAFADQAALAIHNARLFEESQRLAITDPLTGMYNRRYLFQVGEKEVERAWRYGRGLAAILLDIDHFKRVNDTYGHDAGDAVICWLADLCRTSLRNVDVIARYGGEEFAILLPETPLFGAHSAAERLRRAIDSALQGGDAAMVAERLRVRVANTPVEIDANAVRISISLGVASLPAKSSNGEVMSTADGLRMLLTHADRALYRAKEGGRNRVAVYVQDSVPT